MTGDCSLINTLKFLAFKTLANPIRLRRRLRSIKQSGASVVLNLHRVALADGSAYESLSPDLLDDLLTFVKADFHLCTIEELREHSPKPRLVLSFDDGYADFYEVALPILEKHKVRVNQNVIPDCIGSGLPPINVMTQDFLGKAPRELVENLEIPGFCAPITKDSGNIVSNFIKFKTKTQQDDISKVLMPQFENFSEFEPTKMMNIEQVREIAKSHEIGAHSFYHASMAQESDDYLYSDVVSCKTYFADTLGVDVQIYAMPNGSFQPHHIELIRSAGIANILLVGDAFNYAERQKGVTKRFTFHARGSAEMRFKAMGGRSKIDI